MPSLTTTNTEIESRITAGTVIEQYLLVGLAHNPRLEARLIFSRNGIEQSGGQALLFAMRAFLVGMPNVAGIDIGVVDEVKTRKLFHPKAHASRAGAQTRVVVGSANLTRVLDARYFRHLPRSLQQTEDDPGLNRSNE